MRIVVTEESHNHVDWELRRPIIAIEGGLMAGLLVFALLAIPSPSPLRWPVVGAVAGLVVIFGALLAALTPAIDRGHLERLPEGGDLKRAKAWPLVGERLVLDVELADVAGFEVEEAVFEDAPPTTYGLARLWMVSRDGARHPLTIWAQPESVMGLEKALGRALRRDTVVETAGDEGAVV